MYNNLNPSFKSVLSLLFFHYFYLTKRFLDKIAALQTQNIFSKCYKHNIIYKIYNMISNREIFLVLLLYSHTNIGMFTKTEKL